VTKAVAIGVSAWLVVRKWRLALLGWHDYKPIGEAQAKMGNSWLRRRPTTPGGPATPALPVSPPVPAVPAVPPIFPTSVGTEDLRRDLQRQPLLDYTESRPGATW